MSEAAVGAAPVVRSDVRAGDAAAVAAIVRSTGFFREEEVAIAEELVRERLARGEASGYHFVFCEVEGVVAAYACFGPIACTVNRFDLYWIAVHREYQRRGLGVYVLRTAEEMIQAMGGRRVYVETSSREQYTPTREFYIRCGYTLEATLQEFYDEGDGMCIFVKMIQQKPYL